MPKIRTDELVPLEPTFGLAPGLKVVPAGTWSAVPFARKPVAGA